MTTRFNQNVFERLGIGKRPIILAPLAGVSDHPFRRVCANQGAHLTYVEMISSTAMLFDSKRTYDMLKRHSDEKILGVQLTGRSAEEVGKAVSILDGMSFDSIDINMGCPVNKVVKVGCGSGILKDPKRVYETVKAVREATSKPISAKFRLGWDKPSMNWTEVASAIEAGGADWMTIHGRFRSDDYGAPVNLEEIAAMKKFVKIPVIGNGNIFSRRDAELMFERTLVDGIMVSRGALGNPWIFRDLSVGETPVTIDEWEKVVLEHLSWQQEEYGDAGFGAVCMRKHLLWYAKGWPAAKKLREAISHVSKIGDCASLVKEFAQTCRDIGATVRADVWPMDHENRFQWDPKYEMDRKLDRGVGDDGLEGVVGASF